MSKSFSPCFKRFGIQVYRKGRFFSLDPKGRKKYRVDICDMPDVLSRKACFTDESLLRVQKGLDLALFPEPKNFTSPSLDTCENTVLARAWSDDHVHSFPFDATRWVASAPYEALKELVACDFSHDEATDRIAEDLEGFDWRLSELFYYLSTASLPKDLSGFECAVDEDSFWDYLKHFREADYWSLKEEIGEATPVLAIASEVIAVSKEVKAYIDTSLLSGSKKDIEAAAKQALLDSANRQSAISGDNNGWTPYKRSGIKLSDIKT